MLLTRVKVSLAAVLVAGALVGLAATNGPAGASVNWATVTSAKAGGGMAALIAAAKAEGQLNVITLPPDWANYGKIINKFSKKYGIHITSENPDGSSADEIAAVKADRGRSTAPDVLDVGTSYAADNLSLLAKYKVATWMDIPSALKNAKGSWWDDYGGYVAIGCDTSKVTTCPTSFKDLLKSEYKNEVGINGDPTEAGAAFAAVFAAALANGGSFNNIQPGINFFNELNSEGNFVPGESGPTTVESGTTPIVIWWDYLQASSIGATDQSWKVVIPSDATYAAYYTQAIPKDAPDPAAARLWEEYLFSTAGQNLYLEGFTRPVELPVMVARHTDNKAAYAKLPRAPKNTKFPTLAQLTKAANVVDKNWAADVGASS